MGTRADLDALLCETLGSNQVYFQPPESLKMSYPCIVYSLNNLYTRRADNENYYRKRQYDLLYITRDPDSRLIEAIADLPFCSMGSPYSADNLHHYPYTIYY